MPRPDTHRANLEAAARRHPVRAFMLEALLLAAIVAAPLGSAALFLPARRHARDTGVWPAVRRFALAVIGTVVIAAPRRGCCNC